MRCSKQKHSQFYVVPVKRWLISCFLNFWFVFLVFLREPRFHHQAVGSDRRKNQSNSDQPQEVRPDAGDASQTVSVQQRHAGPRQHALTFLTVPSPTCSATDTRLPLDRLITSNSGCSPTETSSRTCPVTTPSSTRWLWTLMECWCLEVKKPPWAYCFTK